MAESGGVNTQTGIFYQNSVAALSLIDLLELALLPPRERVIEVRVEAPEHVDDVVIRYADGHRQFLNIKTNVTPSSSAWNSLWSSLQSQLQHDFHDGDELTIILEEANQFARDLRSLCDRASSSVDLNEWFSRSTKEHKRLIHSIEAVIGSTAIVLEVLRHTSVRILSLDQIEEEFARRRLGGDLTLPATLLSILRDIAAKGARKRALFLSAPLRRRLLNEHNVSISTPAEWGLLAYRSTIARLAQIEIPGTGVSGHVDELFVWPRMRSYNRTRPSDFEDESELYATKIDEAAIDIKTFPSEILSQCVIVAGPGYGKSALLTAISSQLAHSSYVPVLVPLASLASSESNILDFLASQISTAFDVKADWQRLAEQGLLVLLFDGLDEIPSGARPDLLRRISTFSARYTLSPWILTVRDPAVFTITSGAQLIEILSLDAEDIQRFAETIGKRITKINAPEFIRKLRSYPDLARLARIPLFLSMLLVTLESAEKLPTTRSDLIESYLKTIFSPHEHKNISGGHDKATQLRNIAEALAFDRLERQEIGASEREVRNVINRVTEDLGEVEVLFQRLRANGILRQQSAIRLQFPFPIVQEYLAACYLVENYPETLVTRIDDAIHRPWAQVIQFALELHPRPTPIVRAMLDRSDDAFSTGLRLVGRCIANGTKVDTETRDEVSDRLVTFWVSASTHARERTGRLLADAFSSPLRPSMWNALHYPWLLNDGGGEIISKTEDSTLTLSVIKKLMEKTSDRFFMFHSLQPAINKAGDSAFNIIIERMNQAEHTTTSIEVINNLLGHFNSNSVTRNLALAVAVEEQYHIDTRLQAFRIAGAPLDIRSLPLINSRINSENTIGLWIIPKLLAIHQNREDLICNILENHSISLSQRKYIAESISQFFTDKNERIDFIRKCLASTDLDPEISNILRIFLARYGDISIFKELIENIPNLPLPLVGNSISLFGYFADRELAERAAELVRNRVNTVKDAVSIAHLAKIGMLYVFFMDFGFGGELRSANPHAGIGRWMELVEDWCDRADLTELDELKLLTEAAQLGSSRARQRLKEIVLILTNPDDPKYDQDDYGHIITGAIHEVRRTSPLLPLTLAETYVRAAKPNLPIAGIGAIEAHANQPALELMIKLHDDLTEWHLKDSLANCIETLSAKLGILVRKSNKSFKIIK
jgi:hypothetical protein